jgi:hypothetical protein
MINEKEQIMRKKVKMILALAMVLTIFAGKIIAKPLYSPEKDSFFGVGARGDKMFGDYSLGDGTGLSLFYGHRFNNVLTIEISYLFSSNHDTGDKVLFLSDEQDIAFLTNLGFEAFLMDFKIHPNTVKLLKPYLALGFGPYFLRDGGEGFSGFGYLVGFGYDFEYPNWLMDLGLRYHIVNYNIGILNGKRGNLSGSINENTLSLVFNLGYKF